MYIMEIKFYSLKCLFSFVCKIDLTNSSNILCNCHFSKTYKYFKRHINSFKVIV